MSTENKTRGQKAAETRRRNAEQRAQLKVLAEEQRARIDAAQAAVQRVVDSGCCPECGGALRRNLSLTGWWQCEQLGAVGFRKDPSKPSCRWQGFTK